MRESPPRTPAAPPRNRDPGKRGGPIMSKRARKRRDRGKKKANHGKKPNT
ncbi:hypothetical protein [Pseudonocardia sp. NPDC049635]